MALGDWLKRNIIQPVSTGLSNAWNTTKNVVNDYVVEPVSTGLSNAWNTTKNVVNDYVVEPVSTGLSNAWNTTKNVVNDYVVEPVSTGFENTSEVVKENVIEPVKKAFETTGEVVKENVIEPIKNAFEITGEKTGLANKQEEQQKNNEDFNANGNSNSLENAEKENLLKMAWDREDAIRKETQEREDSAYQRAVEDMRKAGINPNLVGINPANSGGGISNATTLESTKNAQLNAYTQELIKQMELEFNLNENQKDRWSNLLSRVLGAIILR